MARVLRQPALFGLAEGHPPIVAGPATSPPVERRRLSGQCMDMLRLLRRGRVTNTALSKISLKYTGRISDLRKAGYDIRCVERDRASGLSWYELHETP
jgi:hypothetical protein